MVNFSEELKSGQFSLYGQWLGLISSVFLILFGIINIFSSLIIFAILAIIFAVFVFLLEIPIFVKLIPGGPSVQTYIDRFENHFFRAGLYFGGSLVMFLSTIISTGSLIVPGITLMGSAGCYAVAGAKGQGHVTSGLVGGTGASGNPNAADSLA